MIIDDTLVNFKTQIFNYILNSDSEKNNGNNAQNQVQNEKTFRSVDETSGVCLNGSCLNYSSLDDNNTL